MSAMQPFRPDEELWWEVARASDDATFFHTPLWHRLAESALPECEDVTAAVETPSGTRVVLPLLRRSGGPAGLLSRVESTFAGCYGGLIADGPLEGRDGADAVAALLRGHGPRFVLSGNPLGSGAAPAGDWGRLQDDSTHLLPLDVPFEEIVGGFSGSHRRSVAKGRGLEVTTRRADSLADYRAYYGAYEASLERWGESATSRYPWDLFEGGWRLSREHPDRIVLWLAEREGRVLAGAWVFYWSGMASYWHGAAHDESLEASATHVLMADLIADARERGLRVLDLGPSGGHEGVGEFKRRFGAREVEFQRRIGEGPLAAGLRSARRLLRGLLDDVGAGEDAGRVEEEG